MSTRWSARRALGHSPRRDQLLAISASSPSSAWAVGEFDSGAGGQALVVHCC